jgi:hypothetical protein
MYRVFTTRTIPDFLSQICSKQDVRLLAFVEVCKQPTPHPEISGEPSARGPDATFEHSEPIGRRKSKFDTIILMDLPEKWALDHNTLRPGRNSHSAKVALVPVNVHSCPPTGEGYCALSKGPEAHHCCLAVRLESKPHRAVMPTLNLDQ